MSESNTAVIADHDSSAIAAIAEASSIADVTVAAALPSLELSVEPEVAAGFTPATAATAVELPTGEVVQSRPTAIPLAAVLLDSNEELAEGAQLAGQPVEELVTKTALGGFGPSAAPKREKPPVELHLYDTPYFTITGKRALTNNTIDFIFTRKSDVVFGNVDEEQDDSVLSAWMIESYARDKYAEAVKEIPGTPDLTTLDYSMVFNLKPVQIAEKTIRDLGGKSLPTGDDAAIYAFILMSPNAPTTDDQLLPVPRSIRINEHASTMMFYAVTTLIKEAFNRGEVGTEPPQATDGDLTMEKIRRAYLKVDPSTAPAKPTHTKKEMKADKAAKVTGAPQPQAAEDAVTKGQIDATVRAPRERAERAEREPREQRDGGTAGRSSDRLLHRHIELSGSRHDDLMAQLRINQKQQGQILEGQQAILKDNETLFSLMNLLMKALGSQPLIK